jgi:hypothetical protein
MKNIAVKYTVKVLSDSHGKNFEIRDEKTDLCLHRGGKKHIKAILSKKYGIKFA